MKILFIYPMYGTGEIPMNLSYLTAIARGRGADVRVFDTSIYRQFSERGDAPQTSVGQFLPTYLEVRLEDSDPFEDLVQLVELFQPDLVCCTSFTNTYKLGLDLLRTIKKVFNIPTLFGGVHTCLVPDQVIQEDCVDMICVGEGEGVIEDLVEGLDKSKIRNLWYKQDGFIHKNPLRPLIDLDTLPVQDFYDYEDFNFYRPLAGKVYKSISFEVSRGCPYKCSYCVNHTFQEMYKDLGKYHRVKSVKKAISDLKTLCDKYGPGLVRFWDEDFTTLPITYLREFAKEYIEHIDLPFIIYARVDTVTEEKVNLLRAMGCITIAMGIESGSQKIRELVLNRHMTDEKIVDSFRLVRSYGIRCSAYNMIGLPHETRENIFETIKLNKQCKPDSSSVAFLEPYQNTRIFNDCVKHGYIQPDYVATFDFFHPHIAEKLITHKELRGLLRTFIPYTKAPRVLWPIIRLCEQGNDWLYKLIIRVFKGR